MTLRVIPGNPMKDKESHIKLFVGNMRLLESSMVDAKKMSDKIEWNELSEKMVECHKKTVEILKYVKDESKKLESKKSVCLRLVSDTENTND
jgi:hypothetical protein